MSLDQDLSTSEAVPHQGDSGHPGVRTPGGLTDRLTALAQNRARESARESSVVATLEASITGAVAEAREALARALDRQDGQLERLADSVSSAASEGSERAATLSGLQLQLNDLTVTLAGAVEEVQTTLSREAAERDADLRSWFADTLSEALASQRTHLRADVDDALVIAVTALMDAGAEPSEF